MDKFTYVKRFAIWTAVVCAVIALIIGLCFGKIVEANLFEEVSKWVVGIIGLIAIIIEPLVIVVIAPYIYDIKKSKGKV